MVTRQTKWNFEQEYARVFSLMWRVPYNDQRPAVLMHLEKKLLGRAVLDVGSGDGYYLPAIKPQRVLLVEPNTSLRRVAVQTCRREGIAVEAKKDLKSLLFASENIRCLDLVLMIHALFYMDEEELLVFLRWVGKRSLVLVYPNSSNAITVEFEDYIGVGASRKKIALKSQILGRPQCRIVTDSHFRLPLDTDVDTLAFLVAHLLLERGLKDDVFSAARVFVNNRIENWRKTGFLELPQAQIIEFFRC
jgi:hypothetical protein